MYDLAIIGAGAGGIEAAKFACKNNLKTAIIEKDFQSWGGICVNKGCIPFKLSLNLAQKNKSLSFILEEEKKVISYLKKTSLDNLVRRGVRVFWGETEFVDENTLKVNQDLVKAKNIIIATGSLPKTINIDNGKDKVIFAQDLFSSIKEEDENFLIIGGGSIGIEAASLLNCLGKKVVVVEKEEKILPFIDEEVAKRLKIILKRKGIEIHTSSDFKDLDLSLFDKILICVGRKPSFEIPGLEKIGIEKNSWGGIKTNTFLQTNIKNIYACGDVTSKKMYAYLAQRQAQIIIKNILGEKEEIDEEEFPEVVFSLPQVAWVGFKEEDLVKKGIKYKVIKTHFAPFSSSYVYDDKEGFIKILVDEEGKILGATIISHLASEIINIFALAIKANLSCKDLKKVIPPHPTISEIVFSVVEISSEY